MQGSIIKLSSLREQIKTSKIRLEMLEEKKMRLDSHIKSITAVLCDLPKGNQWNDKIGDGIAKIAEIIEQITREELYLHGFQREVGSIIDSMPEHTQRLVLDLYYKEGYTLEKVAEIINYSTRQTARIYDKAKKNIKMS